MSTTMIVEEIPELAEDLLGRARSLGESVVTVELPGGENRPEDAVPDLVDRVRDLGANLVLVAATVSGREIGARLAARLGVALIPEAMSVELTDTGGRAERVVYAGGAVQTLQWEGTAVVSVPAHRGVAEDDPGRIRARAVDSRVIRTSLTPRPPTSSNLESAPRIVCVGMGVTDRADLEMIDRLADTLDAQVCCTRPVAEDRGWMPVDHYIGISGLHLSPELYLGLGVSGQVQHAVGMRGSRVVVEVNTDERALSMADADHRVAADLREIVPALAARLTARRGGISGGA